MPPSLSYVLNSIYMLTDSEINLTLVNTSLKISKNEDSLQTVLFHLKGLSQKSSEFTEEIQQFRVL